MKLTAVSPTIDGLAERGTEANKFEADQSFEQLLLNAEPEGSKSEAPENSAAAVEDTNSLLQQQDFVPIVDAILALPDGQPILNFQLAQTPLWANSLTSELSLPSPPPATSPTSSNKLGIQRETTSATTTILRTQIAAEPGIQPSHSSGAIQGTAKLGEPLARMPAFSNNSYHDPMNLPEQQRSDVSVVGDVIDPGTAPEVISIEQLTFRRPFDSRLVSGNAGGGKERLVPDANIRATSELNLAGRANYDVTARLLNEELPSNGELPAVDSETNISMLDRLGLGGKPDSSLKEMVGSKRLESRAEMIMPVPNQIGSAIKSAMQLDSVGQHNLDSSTSNSGIPSPNIPQPQLRVLDLVLQPAELGRVGVRLSLAGPALTVALTVEKTSTKEALDRESASLRDDLNELGYEIEGVYIQDAAPVQRSTSSDQDRSTDQQSIGGGLIGNKESNLFSGEGQARDPSRSHERRADSQRTDQERSASEVRTGLYI